VLEILGGLPELLFKVYTVPFIRYYNLYIYYFIGFCLPLRESFYYLESIFQVKYLFIWEHFQSLAICYASTLPTLSIYNVHLQVK